MNNDEVVPELKRRLNKEGEPWGLMFEVSARWKPDDFAPQFFYRSNKNRSNSAAERQIVSNVEADLIQEIGREILLIPVAEIIDAA